MSEYDPWADYYDLMHQGLPGEAEFYTGQAVRMQCDTLELGCGTGRIAIPMAMSGLNVTGVDVSAEMLAKCAEKRASVSPVKGRLHLVRSDMRDFAFDKRFRLIVMPYRTFMHLLTPEDQTACLRAVRRHLADEGLFIMNSWAAKPSALAPFLTPAGQGLRFCGRHPVPGEDMHLLHHCSSQADEHRQILHEEHLVQGVEEDGAVCFTQSLSITRAWSTPRETGRLVAACGFEAVSLLGDFHGGPFTDSSTEMIWVLRRSRPDGPE
jgi:SAM-dependent methyltransferase